MKCRVRCHILFGLLALLQFGCAYGKQTENDHALMLQTKVENLIEKILKVIEDYYHQIRTELKCIPDEIPDTIIGTLKKAIDCVDQNERTYDSGQITANAHKKAFLKCFSNAKEEVEETINSIDPNMDYCPENMTEKTYQINVTTTFTKTFHINIKNGLEIMKKKVHLGNGEEICVFNQGEPISGKSNQTTPDNQMNTDISDKDNNDADENKVNDLHSKEHHSKGHESKEDHGKGYPSKGNESKESPTQGHESKEHPDNDHKSKEHHGKGYPINEHESKESPTQGHESKEHPDNDHKSKEHHGKEYPINEHESKESPTQGHESKEHPDNDHKSKEHHGKEHPINEHESKESPIKGHESKEIPTQGHDSKEHPDNDHKSKEHHGKGYPNNGHESKEDYHKDHETKVRPNEGNESKESPTQGHVTKEHPGKGHAQEEHHAKDKQSKENHTETVFGISNFGDGYGGNDSSNEDDIPYDTAQEIDDNNNGESDSDLDDSMKELPGYDDDSDDDENENEYSIADEYDEESDSSGTDEDKNGGINKPDSAQDNDEESETEGHYPARPHSKEFHGKGHESKESLGKGPGSEQQPEDYDGSQVDDDDNYENDDVDHADDYDDDDDEDTDFLQEGKENILNSIADLVAHDNETKNKTKDKNPSSDDGIITDDGGNNHLGTDHEKFSFPDTTAKSQLTTRPDSKLATESPANKPFDEDYYADPDTELDDSNYGNEYYDASEKQKSVAENPDKSLDQKPGQSEPNPPVASRIQIKPKNQFKHKPSKPPQNSERHKITLPKTWPKKAQPRIASHSITSLSQSFLQSDF